MMTLAQELVNSRDRHGGNQYKAIVWEVIFRLRQDPEVRSRIYDYEIESDRWQKQLGRLSSQELDDIGKRLGVSQLDLSLLLGWGITPLNCPLPEDRDAVIAELEAIIKERQGG